MDNICHITITNTSVTIVCPFCQFKDASDKPSLIPVKNSQYECEFKCPKCKKRSKTPFEKLVKYFYSDSEPESESEPESDSESE